MTDLRDGYAQFVEIFSKVVALDSVRSLQQLQSLGSCGSGHRCEGFEGASTWTSLKTDLQGTQPESLRRNVRRRVTQLAFLESLVAVSKDQMLRRIRAEYPEMPGLRLTPAQAQRLWGLDEQTCLPLLESLTKDRFLDRRENGTYARLTDGAVTVPPARMVKAERVPRRAVAAGSPSRC